MAVHDLLKTNLEKTRAEAFVLAKVVQDQRQAAITEARRREVARELSEAELRSALQSRNGALAIAASTAAALTAHQQEATLLQNNLDNARAETSTLTKVVVDLRQAAVIEAHRAELAQESIEAELGSAIQSRDGALATAASTAASLAEYQQQAILLQNNLAAELERALGGWEQSRADAATWNRTMEREQRIAGDETMQSAKTTKYLQ